MMNSLLDLIDITSSTDSGIQIARPKILLPKATMNSLNTDLIKSDDLADWEKEILMPDKIPFEEVNMVLEDEDMLLEEDAFVEDRENEAEEATGIFQNGLPSMEKLLEQVETKIAELKEEMKQQSEEEKGILDAIKETLDEHGVSYVYDPTIPRLIDVQYCIDNMPFRINIYVQHKKVFLRAIFPFRAQCNALALLAMYIVEFNKYKDFTILKLDMDDGEISMEYSYLLPNANDYNAKLFWIYMQSISGNMQEVYTRVYRLAVGKVASELKDDYKLLLEKSNAVLEGTEEDEEDIIYGKRDMYRIDRKYSFEEMMNRIRELNADLDSEPEEKEVIVDNDTLPAFDEIDWFEGEAMDNTDE